MPTTANTFPTTASSVDRSGASDWVSPTSIGTDNAADATCASGASGSDYLVGNTFGFSIPSTATIVGVLVRVEASEHATGSEALLAQLQNDNAALFGSSKSTSNEGSISGTGKAIYTYGSASDLWGATITPTIVNDADFGVRLWFTTTHEIRIDFVTIAITYTELATGTMAPSLPLPTMSATGTVSHVGTMAPSLLLPTMSASGSAGVGGTVTGTMAANLLLPTSTATGSRVETGTIATSVPLPTMSATGSRVETGTIAATLIVPTMAATGSRVETGTMAPGLPKPTSSMSGIVNTTVTGTAAPNLPLLTASMTGTVGEVGGGGGGPVIGMGYTIGR